MRFVVVAKQHDDDAAKLCLKTGDGRFLQLLYQCGDKGRVIVRLTNTESLAACVLVDNVLVSAFMAMAGERGEEEKTMADGWIYYAEHRPDGSALQVRRTSCAGNVVIEYRQGLEAQPNRVVLDAEHAERVVEALQAFVAEQSGGKEKREDARDRQ